MTIEKLRRALTALKHASHDQSSHGRRGGGAGGGIAAIVAKRGTPISPDQANMFDVLTPVPAPAPKPAVQQAITPATSAPLPTRRAPNEKAISAHEAEIMKQMPLKKIATPEQKAAYQKLARRIAEFADENDAIREQYLYKTGPDGKLQYDESATGRRGELYKVFEDRGKQIISEVMPIADSLSFGDLAMPFDQWRALAISDRTPMSGYGTNTGAIMLREAMRVRDPGGNNTFPVTYSKSTTPFDLKQQTEAVAQIDKIVKPYVFTPSAAENKPVLMFADNTSGLDYLAYYKSPRDVVQTTVDNAYNIPIDTAAIVMKATNTGGYPAGNKQNIHSTIAIHEYGHHLEQKPGALSYVETWYRNKSGNDMVNNELGTTYAAYEAKYGPTNFQFGVKLRGVTTATDYQRQVYARAYTPNDADKGIRFSGTELTSVTLERFHAPFLSRQNTTDGHQSRQMVYFNIKRYPDIYGAMFAVTQS